MYTIFRKIVVVLVLPLIIMSGNFGAFAATYTDDDINQDSPANYDVSEMPEEYKNLLPPPPWAGHSQNRLSEVSEIYVPPTCEINGYYEKIVHCGACNRDLRQHKEFPALGHDMKDGVCQRIGCEYTEQIYVTVTDTGDKLLGMVDETGSAVIKDFFTAVNSDVTIGESITLMLDDTDYSFTRYANGEITGNLPEGFEIVGTDLYINGVNDNIDITVTERQVIPSLTIDEKSLSESLSLDFSQDSKDDDSFEDIPDSNAERNNSESESTSENSSADVNSLSANAGTRTASTDDTSGGTANDNDLDSSVSDVPGGGANQEASQSLDTEYSEGGPSTVLLAVDLALALGLVTGIGVLLKLGVVKF